jgi:hypothetical protein
MTLASEQLWETFSGPQHQFIRRRVPDPEVVAQSKLTRDIRCVRVGGGSGQ